MSETTGYNGVVHRLRELLELIGVPAEHCLPERLVERIEVAKEDVRHDRAALATAQRERAEWEANAKRENAMLVQAQQRIAELERELSQHGDKP